MKNNCEKALYSSRSEEWETPQQIFDELNLIHNFDLDAFASDSNHKCPIYFTKKDNALIHPWGLYKSIFVNPPYGDAIYPCMEKVRYEYDQHGMKIVCLLPVRTDTAWFHDFVYRIADLYFIRGRLKFSNKGSATFPSMIAIFKRKE